ncbi:hypothetical protein [Lactovum odontotermitis]
MPTCQRAHDAAVRELNEAEDLLYDYRQRLSRQTGYLVDQVAEHYRDLPYGAAKNFSSRFEQTVEEYNWEIRKKLQEVEEARDEERRSFSRKMDE